MSNTKEWIQTFTGKQFWPLNPNPDDVDIRDISHALAMQCRYNGHCQKYYCPTPEQRVLTDDLRWVPAGDLRIGDGLFSFDEHPHEIGSCGKRRRRMRPARVVVAEPVKRTIIRLELEDGSSIRASSEHPWLVATKVSRNQTWKTSEELFTAVMQGRRRYMHKFIEPWSTIETYKTGWLSGMYDGEGYLSIFNRGGMQMGVSQKPGPVLAELENTLSSLGFSYSGCHTGTSGTVSLQSKGGWRGIVTLLGTIRPMRLLSTFTAALHREDFCKQLDGVRSPLKIVNAYNEGDEWVAGIETTTHTYLCEGFGAHNSVAEHSVRISDVLPQDLKLWGLLHDAAEAYIGDMIRPVKSKADWFNECEDKLLEVIAQHFKLPWPIPKEIWEADDRMLVTEVRDILAEPPVAWNLSAEPYFFKIDPLSPEEAERWFLSQYRKLTT